MEKRPYSDRRWRDNPGFITAKCGKCKHFNLGTLSCKGFERIPDEILTNKVFHDHAIAGDHGYRYEERE